MGTPIKKRDPLKRIYCFPPVFDRDCTILIISTMPGEHSLLQNYYYAHPKNLFWNYLYRILLADYDAMEPFDTYTPFEARYRLLLDNQIAVWDILSDCLRDGASDSKITDQNYNSIHDFIEGTNIKVIFCNGGPALHYLKKSGEFKKLEIPVVLLGSSSTSNQNNPFATMKKWKNAIVPHLRSKPGSGI